jgi:guanylate kinase
MYKIIALMGEAGSGKSTCLNALLTSNPAYHKIISCTTRPAREGEIDGVDYYFITTKQFEDSANDGQMFEVSTFNTWYYGTPESSLDEDKINVGVFNPEGIWQLVTENEVELKVYYLRTSTKERLLRQLNREDNPRVEEIIRRFSADQKDFKAIEYISRGVPNKTELGTSSLGYSFKVLQNETKKDLDEAVAIINKDNLG